MSSIHDSVEDRVNAALAEFEVWCEQNDSCDIEQYIQEHQIPDSVAERLRDHLKRERVLRENLRFPSGDNENEGAIRAGQKVGRYTLLQSLGEGGMGSVWLAEQHYPVRRQVAVKLIRPGFDTQLFVKRFEAERQALAMMDHPNIARVFDAGSTEDARPYFVMEYLTGTPLNKFCSENQLDPEKRLRLFLNLCNAVQHAHQKGIIHRDLKPSNVLICDIDGNPTVKVIDFGLAKACKPEGQISDQPLTQVGAIVGSLPYMSPEQARGSGDADQDEDIDTSTDVYSLGAILFELLTSTTPLPKEELRSAGFESLRLIQEKEPPRPSARLREKHIDSSSVVDQFSTSEQRMIGILRGDLDWIAMRAIEKDRSRRYPTVSDLAQDIQRFLNGQPVEARPPSGFYRFGKFARRNKIAVLSSAIVLAAILIGAGVATWLAFRATAAETSLKQRNEQLELSFDRVIRQQKEIKAQQIDALVSKAQWEKGLKAIDEYQDLYQELPIDLQIKRLPALDGLLQDDELKEEIDLLIQSDDYVDQKPVIDLWRTHAYFIDEIQPEDARETLTRLIPQLDGADRHFARGLNTELLSESIECFRAGLEIDPFHLQCRIQLVTTLILLGRYDVVQKELRTAKSFFPEDPRFFFADILAHALAGRYDLMEISQKDFQRRFPDYELSQLRKFIRLIQIGNEQVDRLGGSIKFADMMRLFGAVAEIKKKPKSKAVPATDYYKPQFVRAAENWWSVVLDAKIWFLSAQRRQKLLFEALEECYGYHPDGFFKLLQGFCVPGHQKSIECFDKAIGSDSVFPRVHRQALFCAGSFRIAQFGASKKQVKEKMELMNQGLAQLEKYLSYDGEITNITADILIFCFGRGHKWDLALKTVERQIEAGKDQQRILNVLLSTAVKRGNVALAIATCDRLLELDPENEKLITQRNDLMEKLSVPQPAPVIQ
jgi:serine/threonine protein kinase/type II secretory pathway pseudopilin PulG